MLVTNNKENVRYLFYTVAGEPKSVKFGPLESLEISDLTSTEQITYNSLDYKLLGINERFGNTFPLDFTVNDDVVQPLGTIFSDNFARASIGSDYTNSSNNFSTNGTELIANNVTGATFGSLLLYSKNGYSSNLEKYTQTVTFNTGSLNGYGIALGVSGLTNIAFLFFLNTIPGRVRAYYLDGSQIVDGVPANDIPPLANQNIQLTLTYESGTFTFTVLNLDTLETNSLTYTYSITYPVLPAEFQPINFQPFIGAIGGTQTISNWTYSSEALVHAQYGFVGDSITAGFFANTVSNRWATIVSTGQTYNIYAGPNVKSGEINISEVASLKAKKLIISIGTNDVTNSVPTGTIISNILAIKTAAEAQGSEVIICKIPPCNGVDIDTYNTALVTNFGAAVKVDFYTLLVGVGNNYAVGKSPDGIHPASTQQTIMAAEVLANI